MHQNKDILDTFILIVEILYVSKANSENVSSFSFSFSFFEVVAGQVWLGEED